MKYFTCIFIKNLNIAEMLTLMSLLLGRDVVVVVDLLFNVHGKHRRSCRDGQLT